MIISERKQPAPAGFWTLMQSPLKLFFMVVLPGEFGHIHAQLGEGSIPPMELPGSDSLSRLKRKMTAVHGAAVLSQQRP